MDEKRPFTADNERQRQLIDSFAVYCSILSPEERELINDPIRRARVVERCVLPIEEKNIFYSPEFTLASQLAVSDNTADERKIIEITTPETLSQENFSQLFVDNPELKVVLISETYSQRIETEWAKAIRKDHPNVLFIINNRRGKQEASTCNTFTIDENISIPQAVYYEYGIDNADITITLADIIESLKKRDGHYIDYLTFELAYRVSTPDELLNILGINEQERYRFFAFIKRNVEFLPGENIEAIQFQPIDPHIIRKALMYWMDMQEQWTTHTVNLHTVVRVINGIAGMFLIPDIIRPASYYGIDHRIDKFVKAIVNYTIARKTESLELKQPVKRSERWKAGNIIISKARKLWGESYDFNVLHLPKDTHIDSKIILTILDLIFPANYIPEQKVPSYQMVGRIILSVFPNEPTRSRQLIEQVIMRTVVKIADQISWEFPDESEEMRKQIEIYKPRKKFT